MDVLEDDDDFEKLEESFVRRILLLEDARIGCGNICTCRAELAGVLDEDIADGPEMARVRQLVDEVLSGASEGGPSALRELLAQDGPIHEEVDEVLAAIENTPPAKDNKLRSRERRQEDARKSLALYTDLEEDSEENDEDMYSEMPVEEERKPTLH